MDYLSTSLKQAAVIIFQ
jgi:hypothetical protein